MLALPPHLMSGQKRFIDNSMAHTLSNIVLWQGQAMIVQRPHGRLSVMLFKVMESRPKNLGDKDKARGTPMAGDRGL